MPPYDPFAVVISVALAIVAGSVASWWLAPPLSLWRRAGATLVRVAVSICILVWFRANR